MSVKRSLSRIRKEAPPQDRSGVALAPAATAFARPKDTRYATPTPLRPETLGQLATMCGELGPAAVEQAIWSSVSAWYMRGVGFQPGTGAALTIHVTSVRTESGWPFFGGRTSHGEKQSKEAAAEAARLATQVREAWQDAGGTVSRRTILWQYQHVLACRIDAKPADDSSEQPPERRVI